MSKYRNFGLLLAALFLTITIYMFSFEYIINNILFYSISLLIILFITFIYPILLKPLYLIWMFIGHWLGKINTFIIFTVIYFLIITPLSFLSHLFSSKKKEGEWANNHENETTNFSKQY